MNGVLMDDKWNGVWMTSSPISGRVEFQSVRLSVRGEDSLGRIGLKEKVGFQLFVELGGREWEERVVGLSRWHWRMSTQMFGQWIPESRSLVVEGSVSIILNRDGLEGRWRVTTADERVEWVGWILRRSRIEEGCLNWSDLYARKIILYCMRCVIFSQWRFEVWSEMIAFRGFSDSTSNRVEIYVVKSVGLLAVEI